MHARLFSLSGGLKSTNQEKNPHLIFTLKHFSKNQLTTTRMNKKFLLTFGALAVLLACSLLLSACSDDPTSSNGEDDNNVEVVNFTDQRLEAQVRLALAIDENVDLTPALMLELDTLNINAGNDTSGELSGISDLTGLEFALNLVYLRLSATSITNLAPISNLEKIEYLRFNNTPITDLSPLSNFTSLTYFNANTVTGITDISPLAGNTGLRTAILRNVPFGNDGMETIRNFTTLHRINMRDTGVTDISVLGELMASGALLNSTPFAQEENGGAVLDLRGLDVEDWSPIAPYVDQISDLSGVPANETVIIPDPLLEDFVRNLLEIDPQNDVTTLYMTGIDTLNINNINAISDLTGLEFAPNIRYLRFGGTSVTDLNPIQGLEKVEYLRLNDTNVTDISPISGYTTLTYFNANSTTGITDISPLEGNENLQVAILRSVPFGNDGMSTIRTLTSLYRLNMRNTGVTDISILGEMMAEGALIDSTPGAEAAGGATLDLRQLNISDYSPIEPYIDQITNLDGYPAN